MKTLTTPSLPAAPPAHAAAAADRRLAALDAQASRTDISITTREGDTVTISEAYFASRQAAVAQTGTGAAMEARATSTDSFSLRVEGDLSEQELRDLSALLDDLTAIAADFFAGDLDGAMAGAMDGLDLGASLYSVDASFTRTSVLATYLESGHPLPTMPAGAFDAEEGFNPADFHQAMADQLQAQWDQFLQYLDQEHEENNSGRPAPAGQRPTPREAGSAMLTRALRSVNAYPRLAPIVPALGNLAIEMAESTREAASSLRGAFLEEFNAWLA